MTAKIDQFKQLVTDLQSFPDDVISAIEVDPDNIDAYYLLMDQVQQVLIRSLFSFPKIKIALDIKYNSGGATYQNIKEISRKEINEAEFKEHTSHLQNKSLSEIVELF